jgi:hypothetical protein
MWAKIKAACLHSLTVAWSYVLFLAGSVMSLIDTLASVLGDPSLKDQISAAVGDAKTTGRILLSISVITLLSRLRTLGKGQP